MKRSAKIGLALTLVLVLASALLAQPNNAFDYDNYLIKSLNDENIGIRASAAQLLGDRKVDLAVEPLMTMLQKEDIYSARIVAAIALYKIGDEKAYTIIKKTAKNDSNQTVRRVLTGIVRQIESAQYAQK